jgi:hypothetical protein
MSDNCQWTILSHAASGNRWFSLEWTSNHNVYRWHLQYSRKHKALRITNILKPAMLHMDRWTGYDSAYFWYDDTAAAIRLHSHASFRRPVPQTPLSYIQQLVAATDEACINSLVSFSLPIDVARLAAEFVH